MYYYYWGAYVLGAVHIKRGGCDWKMTAKTNTYTDYHTRSIMHILDYDIV